MELLHALKVQGRVISALTLRETRSRYGNSKLGFFWALFEPFAHIAVFMLIFTFSGRAAPIGDSIGIFILTGILPWLIYSNIVSRIMMGVSANKPLLGYPQVMPIDISISRIILEVATLFVVMIFFLAVGLYMGVTIKIDSFLTIMSVVGLLILLGTGIGLINSALMHYFPSYGNLYSALSRPMYFMSGVFFTANFLSPRVYELIDFNPLLHLIEWFRTGFYASFDSRLYDAEYTVSVTLVIFSLGLLAEKVTRKRAREP